ncbi:hypothetical protein ACA910_022362 [Epithemia clementina (nom. ined.)]
MWNSIDPNSSEANDRTTLSESLLGGGDSSGIPDQPIEEQVVFVDETGDNGGGDHASLLHTVGERQPNHWRDAWAALLFLVHQVAIFYLAFAWGVPALSYEYPAAPSDDNSNGGNHSTNGTGDFSGDDPSRYLDEKYTGEVEEGHLGGFLLLCFISSIGALLIGATAMSVMIRFAEKTIHFSLFFTVFCNVVVTISLALERHWLGFGVSAVCLVLVVLYTQQVWSRVPFAASNLLAALTAVQSNGGIVLVSLGVTVVVTLWTLVWILAAVGVYMKRADCDSGTCTTHTNGFFFLLLLLSYYWTSEVSKNVMHVTTAGTVGTWWFAPDEASTFCSPAISDSLCRATTFSLGSICFGSLLTAVLQLLHQMCRDLKRRSSAPSVLLCIVEFMLHILERLVSYFNKWAYIYVGLYGYNYLDSGRKVVTLFRERGWTTIINDQLVVRALFLVSLVIGALTGCLGLAFAGFTNWMSDFGAAATPLAFFIPFVCGLALSMIFLSVVESAVDTIIVSFAEAPLEFERNHPGLYTQMCQAWRLAFPDEFRL